MVKQIFLLCDMWYRLHEIKNKHDNKIKKRNASNQGYFGRCSGAVQHLNGLHKPMETFPTTFLKIKIKLFFRSLL